MNEKKSEGRLRWILLLQAALLIYSTSGLFSKNASAQKFLSPGFILFYGGMIMVLGIYAVLWQQVIAHVPVTTAYANKAITVIWGVILGKVFFGENIKPLQGVACLVIIAGTVMFVRADQKENKEKNGEGEKQ